MSMFKKLLRVVVPVGIVTGLYFYGDSLPSTSSSGGATSAGAGATGRLDRPEYTIDVKKVGQSASVHFVDITVRAKVPLRISGIEVHAGTIGGGSSGRRGQLVGGSEVRVENASDVNLKEGEARVFRGEAPRGEPSNTGSFGDELIRTSVKLHYPGGAYSWDANNPRYRGVVDTRLR